MVAGFNDTKSRFNFMSWNSHINKFGEKNTLHLTSLNLLCSDLTNPDIISLDLTTPDLASPEMVRISEATLRLPLPSSFLPIRPPRLAL